MGLHFIKNGTKHDVCVKRPSLFPASATTYDNTNHPELPNRAQGAIDGLADNVNRGSVSVTADGVKTNGQLYAELHSLIDYSKVTKDAVLQIGTQFWTLKTIAPTYLTFSRLNTGSTGGNIIELTISNNPARYALVFTTAPGISVLDEIPTVPNAGIVHTLRY